MAVESFQSSCQSSPMSSNIFRWVPILAVVAIQFLLLRTVSSQNVTNEYLNHHCNNTQGTYTPGSAFEKILNRLIHNVSRLDLGNGYTYEFEFIDDSNKVSVLLQCRGDSYGSKCHSCFAIALSELRKRCPGNKGAIIWYDQCLLEISTVYSRFNPKIDYNSFFNMTNPKNVSSDPKQFERKRKNLFQKLLLEAAKDMSKSKDSYGVGETRIGNHKMYAMMQCTLDLTSTGCHVCLEWILEAYDLWFDRRQGARVVGRSCSLRYEFYPFLRR